MKRKKTRAKPRPVPGELPLVLDFVNTWNAGAGEDTWTDPAALGRFLEQRGLTDAAASFDAADLQRAVQARHGVRALLLANSGAKLTVQAVTALDQLAASAACRLRFGDNGRGRLDAGSSNLDGVLGRILGIVALAQGGEDWPRLKICDSSTCRRAFYDAATRRPSQFCDKKCRDQESSRHYRRKYKARTGHMPPGGRYY